MEYCVRHLFMCANPDANASSSMSHTVAHVRDGVPSNPSPGCDAVAGHVCCGGQDAQMKDGAIGGGELEMEDGVSER